MTTTIPLPPRVVQAFYAAVAFRPTGDILARLERGSVDWDALVRIAVELSVAPFVYRNLPVLPRASEMSEAARSTLAQAYATALKQSTIARREYGQLSTSFANAGVPVIPLKGLSLLLRTYPAGGVRGMRDLDLLVPEGDVPRALAVLERDGYRVVSATLRGALISSHGKECVLSKPGRMMVDLHFRLFEWHQERYVHTIDSAAVWEGAETASVGVLAAQRFLRPGDEFLHTIFSTWEFFDRTFRHYLDADALVRVHGETFDWERITAFLLRHRAPRHIRSVLSVLAHGFGTPLPVSVLRAFVSPSSRRGLREPIANDLQFPHRIPELVQYGRMFLGIRGFVSRSAFLLLYLRWHAFKTLGLFRNFFIQHNNPLSVAFPPRESPSMGGSR